MPEYQLHLDAKCRQLTDAFASIGAPPPDVFASAPTHYRQRCELHIWQEGERVRYAMFEPGSRVPYCLDQFDPASERINRAMPLLLDELNANPVLRKRLFEVDFLSGLSGDLLISLIYHRRLDEAWDCAAAPLQRILNASIIGRSKGQKRVLSQDFITERLPVAGREWIYRHQEGAFSQPNAGVNCQMIQWAMDMAGHNNLGDLLELYCGAGNFTLPLSTCFRRVFATEISKSSVAALAWNQQANGVENLQWARLSAVEMRDALAAVRPFRRLQGIDLTSYHFSHLFVDPPRAGLDAATLAFASEFDRVIYISCNPETLIANLQVLQQTHRVERTALFDQFPFTPHLESGVLLSRRT